MDLVIGSVLSVLLFNALIVFRAKRLRRLAEARLEIVHAVTDMELLMMKGEIKSGDILHDEFFEAMLASQYAEGFSIRWEFWQLSPKVKAVRERLCAEIAKQTEVGKLLGRFAKARYRAFENRHPIMSVAFVLWLLACAGGMVVLLGGLLGYLGFLHLHKTIRKGAVGFKQMAAASYTSYEMSEQCAQ